MGLTPPHSSRTLFSSVSVLAQDIVEISWHTPMISVLNIQWSFLSPTTLHRVVGSETVWVESYITSSVLSSLVALLAHTMDLCLGPGEDGRG